MGKNKFSLDDVDMTIIYLLFKTGKPLTTTQITKLVFPTISNDYELRKKDNFIRSRMKKLESMNILLRIDNGEKSTYIPNLDNVDIGESILTFQSSYKKVKLDLGKTILIRIGDYWTLFEIKNKKE